MAKVLITGNLGYNGVWVTKCLNKNSYHTIGLDTDYYPYALFGYKDFVPKDQILKDIRDIEEKDLEGVEAVVHLAALANDAVGEIDPQLTMAINKEAAIEIAKLAKDKGAKKFIYASSCSIYGRQSANTALNEECPLGPLTAYAKAKAEAEKGLAKMADKSFKVVIMRNATMHGVSPKLRLDLVANNLTASAHLYNKTKILSDGTPWRPLLNVVNFANIVLNFLETEPKHLIYNVGFNQENYRIREIGEIISEVTGTQLEVNSNKTPDERSYRVDFSRLQNEYPDLKQETTFRDSIIRLAEAYKDNNLTENDFLGHKYFRLRALKDHLQEGRLDSNLLWSQKK